MTSLQMPLFKHGLLEHSSVFSKTWKKIILNSYFSTSSIIASVLDWRAIFTVASCALISICAFAIKWIYTILTYSVHTRVAITLVNITWNISIKLKHMKNLIAIFANLWNKRIAHYINLWILILYTNLQSLINVVFTNLCIL